MTVAELIKELQEYDSELEVVVGPLGWGDPIFTVDIEEDVYQERLLVHLRSQWRNDE